MPALEYRILAPQQPISSTCLVSSHPMPARLRPLDLKEYTRSAFEQRGADRHRPLTIMQIRTDDGKFRTATACKTRNTTAAACVPWS